MNTLSKVAIALGTLFPILLLVGISQLIHYRPFQLLLLGTPLILAALLLVLLTIVPSALSFLFYLFHLIRNHNLSDERKVAWLLILFIGSFIGQIAYWYLHIWRTSPATTPKR